MSEKEIQEFTKVLAEFILLISKAKIVNPAAKIMWPKPLKFWCGISLPGAVLLTWVFPAGAADNSGCNEGEKLAYPLGYLCDPAVVQTDTASGLEEYDSKSVKAQNPQAPLPPENLPPDLNRNQASRLENLQLNPNRDRVFQPAPVPYSEHNRSTLQVQTPAGLSPSDILRPDLSRNQAPQLENLQLNPNRDRIPQAASVSLPELPSSTLQAQTPTVPRPENLQPDPNRDRFPQPAPAPVPELPSSTPSVQPPSNPSPETAPSSATVQVNKIKVSGSSVFSEAQLSPITKTVEGRTATLEELRGVADKITQLYLDRGYITSRALLVDQVIKEGIVEIRVIEGSLERIDVQGTRRLQQSYVRSRVQLGAGAPLNTGKLEDQLRLLRADPLFENVEASLRPGTGQGQSILIVRVTEANPFEGSVGSDNYSPPSVGSERFGVNLRYRNLTGRGDEIAGSYYRTATGGADVLDFSYRLPVNAMNGTLQLRAAPNRNKVTQPPFDVFDIRGESQLYEISYRQPFVRSPREEFALSWGFAYQSGQTFTFAGPTPFGEGPDRKGVSRTSVFKFGQDYLRRDVSGAWSFRSLFSLGTGLLNATINPDPKPDSRFLSWLGQIQRVQIISPDNFLIISGDVQLATTSLLPSQQFVIGGGQSLRGYRQNVRAGDNGFRFSIEDRITVQRNQASAAVLQLAPFVDVGTVWNVPGDPNEIPRQRFLAGIGLGVIWQPLTNLNVRLDYGVPLVDLKDRGNNVQDSGFYFSVNYQL